MLSSIVHQNMKSCGQENTFIRMSIKDKIMDIIITHPKLVTFGIGLAITFVIGTAIGIITDPQHALAVKPVEG